jgi:hypothetical protein
MNTTFFFQVGKKAVRSALNLSKTVTLNEVKEKMEDIYQNKERGRAIIDSSYKSLLDKITNKINKYVWIKYCFEVWA